MQGIGKKTHCMWCPHNIQGVVKALKSVYKPQAVPALKQPSSAAPSQSVTPQEAILEEDR